MTGSQRRGNKHSSRSVVKKRSTLRRVSFESLESRRVMATFQVTNAKDDGPGSLRAAIVNSNSTIGRDIIEFAIASADQTIDLQTALPFVTDPVVIDATTQPGYVDQPLVQVDGAAILTNNASGLYITAGNSVDSRSFRLRTSRTEYLLKILAATFSPGNYIGLTPSGAAAGNRVNGIILVNSGNNISWRIHSEFTERCCQVTESLVFAYPRRGIDQAIAFKATLSAPMSVELARVQIRWMEFLSAARVGTFIGTDGDELGDSGEGNLISGNTGRGIRLFGASNNASRREFDWSCIEWGTTALPNAMSGVTIDGGSNNNRVGTDGDGRSDALEKNTISGNSIGGIQMFDSNSNIIAGNNIGTSTDGLQLVRNRAYGLHLGNSNNNRIGTNADGVSDLLELNLISGNETNAIQFSSSDFNVVAGNWLGLSSDGETPIENGHSGIWIYAGSSANLIGTNDDGVRDEVERNVIAGNRFQGVAIDGSLDVVSKTENNVVAGNFIGTDKTGTKAVANETGVFLRSGAISNIIGTQATSRPNSAAGNVISGNQFNGVLIRYSGTNGNHVSGNLIGLSADGMHPLGNKHAGVTIAEGPVANFIGGASPKEANTIGANENHGVWIVDGSPNNFVDGNFIGFAIDRATAMGNGVSGLTIENSSQNQIGTTVANTIAHNAQAGIAVTSNSSFLNNLSKNSIYGNAGISIDLGNDGPDEQRYERCGHRSQSVAKLSETCECCDNGLKGSNCWQPQ